MGCSRQAKQLLGALGCLHSWNFPLGSMYSGHIHSEISCSVGTDKKAVRLGNNCAPFRHPTDWCILQRLSQTHERCFCVQVLSMDSLVHREQQEAFRNAS